MSHEIENGHSAKRQRTGDILRPVEGQWQPPHANSGFILPPIQPAHGSSGSPGHPSLYQPSSRPASSPRSYPDVNNGHYEMSNKFPPPVHQESRQPSVPYNSHHPYESMVKRESESSHESRYPPPPPPSYSSPRPGENGHHRSPTTYQPQPQPRPPPYEQPNGNVAGAPPFPNRATQMPLALTMNTTRTSFDQHSGYAQSPDATVSASADGIYSPNPYGAPQPSNNAGKKKAQRASQACDSCRSLKAKCDESKPCQSCKDKDIKCTYRTPEPKAQDKMQSEMSDKIKEILIGVTTLREEMARMNERMQSLEQKVPITNSPTPSPAMMKSEKTEQEVRNGIHSSRTNDANHHSVIEPEIMDLDTEQKADLDSEPAPWQDASSDEEIEPPLNPNKPKFGIQHTTGAAELLSWVAISDLVSDEVKDSRVNKGKGAKTDRYLWKAEKRRGEMRLHGYGEGAEPKAPREWDGDGSDGLSPRSDALSPYIFSEGPFGQCAGPAYDSYSQKLPKYTVSDNPKQEMPGGLCRDGTLDLSETTVNRLITSYEKNMNILHPILTHDELWRLARNLLREVKAMPDTETKREKKVFYRQFVGQSSSVPSNLGKRHRGTSDHGEHPDAGASPDIPSQLPQRSPSNAVVLLMLAIGSICEAKGKQEISWGAKDLSSADMKRIKGSTSPDHSSPSSPVSSTEQPSPHSLQNLTSLPSIPPFRLPQEEQNSISDRTRPMAIKNKDVVRGAAYMAIATDIIGNEVSGSTIHHIQANILASLYYGQLVRPIQSHSHLHVASRAIQDEIRLKSSLTNLPPGTRFCQWQDNPLVYAFWTCLQLESDIVAELACAHSGILGYEELMPYPNTEASVKYDKMEDHVAWSYDAQLWLRKHLNDIHAHYTPKDPHSSYHLFTSALTQPKKFASIEAVEDSRVSQFGVNRELGKALWPTLTWNFDDKDPDQATEILRARTRAKFYGARVITYRPFVQAIMKYSWDQEHAIDGENPVVLDVDRTLFPGVHTGNLNAKEPTAWLGARDTPFETKVKYSFGEAYWEYFGRGISALINSTTAFHGITDEDDDSRLIVTNVFGTVHAQWGNVLVLLACYRDRQTRSVLLSYINEDKFKSLVWKTMKFLKVVAPSTCGLQVDIKILKAAAIKAGLFTGSELGTPRAYADLFSTPISNDTETPKIPPATIKAF